ncbi:MAG: hypothetical protein LBQ74_09750 [Prevotella sp.]|jgi:uncharacterized membrane protein YadS|nr:hypothetical protein [Prevotella sp.]
MKIIKKEDLKKESQSGIFEYILVWFIWLFLLLAYLNTDKMCDQNERIISILENLEKNDSIRTASIPK